MRQETQWTTIFWEGLDGAGALRSGGVLARQCGAGLSGCALAGAGPCGGGPRPLGRVVALGGEGPPLPEEELMGNQGGYILSRKRFFFKWVARWVRGG